MKIGHEEILHWDIGWTKYISCQASAGGLNVILAMDIYERLEMHDIGVMLMQYDWIPFFSTSSPYFYEQVFIFSLFFRFFSRNSLAFIEKNFRRGEMGDRVFLKYFWLERKRGVGPNIIFFAEGWGLRLTLSEREEKGKGRGSKVNLIGKRRKGS